MNPDIERIELPDGGWWEIKKWLNRGDRKKLNALEREWVTVREDLSAIEAAENPAASLVANPEKMDVDARDDLMLQLGTVAWSFSKEFSIEACDQIKDTYVDKVIERMRELYAAEDEALVEAKKD